MDERDIDCDSGWVVHAPIHLVVLDTTLVLVAVWWALLMKADFWDGVISFLIMWVPIAVVFALWWWLATGGF